MRTLEEAEYQTWPESRKPERLRCMGANGLSFRLPRWTQNAADGAIMGFRSNVVSFTACCGLSRLTALLCYTVQPERVGASYTKQPKGGKQVECNTNPQISLQPQIQQSQSKKKQLQSQQSKSQHSSSKKQQPQRQQPQKQQPHSNKPRSQSNKQLQQGKQPRSRKKSKSEVGT